MAPLFNDSSPPWPAADHAAALPQVRGFPALGVLRRLRHDPMPTAGVTPAHHPAGCSGGQGGTGSFPTFTDVRCDGVGAQLYPGGIATGRTSQSWPGPPAAQITQTTRAGGPKHTTRPAPQATHPPDSAGRGRLTGLLPLVRFPYAFPSSLAGTSRLVVPARPYIVEAAPDLTPDPRIDLPPASTGHCDNRRRVSHPARLPSALRGARVFSSIDNTTAPTGGSR